MFSRRTLLRCNRGAISGFTLIEVLIAIVLLAVISLLLWQSMGSAIGSKDRSEKRDQAYRGASLAVDRIARDLSMAVLYTSMDFLGISGSAEQIMKSVLIGTNEGDQDKLTFDTISHVRYLKDTKESDMAEVTYFLEKEDLEEDQDEAMSGLYALKKREKSPPDSEPDKGGSVQILLGGVKELNFRYYDLVKNEFLDEWDTTKIDFANRLPRAVEITLIVQDPLDEDATIRMSTVTMLEMAPGPNDF